MAQTPPQDNYILQRDLAASTRLNAQHWVWQREIGFTLHPDIPSLHDGSRVADVATGTGAWLLEAAGSHPNISFDGFDISLSQCPSKNLLPSNVTTDVWDIFQDPPEHLVAKYDVVHTRLILLVIDKDPVPVLTNLAKLLKPGGYIQWEEHDLTRTVVYGKEEGLKVDGHILLDKVMKGRFFPWVLNLPETMSNNGFENARCYRFPPKREYSRYMTEVHILSFVEILAKLEDLEKRSLFTTMVQKVSEEVPHGAAHGVTKAVFLAKKTG